MKRTLFAILTSVLCLTMQAQDQITATIETLTQGREWNLNISLANATPYVSFQFDVILPQGVTYADVIPDQRISSLTVTTGMVSDNKLRVTAYNANSQATLTSGTGNILSLRLTSETSISGGTIKVTNCLFTSLQGTDYTETTLPAVTVQMPDVTVVTLYKLTYIVDGEVYKELSLEYGAPITPEPAPTKVDWEFSGWKEEIPTTMPAHDVTITGSFDVFTSITSVEAESSEKQVIYNINGVRSNKIRKGLNIVNGRKVVY